MCDRSRKSARKATQSFVCFNASHAARCVACHRVGSQAEPPTDKSAPCRIEPTSSLPQACLELSDQGFGLGDRILGDPE